MNAFTLFALFNTWLFPVYPDEARSDTVVKKFMFPCFPLVVVEVLLGILVYLCKHHLDKVEVGVLGVAVQPYYRSVNVAKVEGGRHIAQRLT